MPPMQLFLSPAEFVRLPRNAAYKYNYHDCADWINPQPRYYHAMLSLADVPMESRSQVQIGQIEQADWEPLTELFADTFALQQPFAGQEKPARCVAAQEVLARTT